MVADYKYDGERTQIHFFATEVHRLKRMSMFSRNFDRQNRKFWHFESLFKECISSRKTTAPDFIIDGELVYLDTRTGNMLPFQEIERKLESTMVEQEQGAVMPGKRPKLFAFDILALGKESLCHLDYDQRVERLQGLIDSREL